MQAQSFHENLAREEAIKGSSDRSFGLFFAIFFVIIGTVQVWAGHWLAFAWFIVAGLFATIALARPALLAPLNRLWGRFGLLLFHVVNPVVMGILYYVCVVPIGLLMRALGKDPLRRKFEPAEETYWIRREPPGPPSESMRNQF